MKYIVFLMLAICAGCSGQNKNEAKTHGPVGSSLQVFSGVVGSGPAQYDCDTGGNCTLKNHSWGSVTGLIPADRFENCVTFEGIHYCPEGRYIQVQDDAKRPDPYGICSAYPMLDGCKVPDFKQNTVCPNGFNCYEKSPVPGMHNVAPLGDSTLDGTVEIPQIKTYSQSCSIDAGGLFVCDSPAPTTKKDPKGPSCSLWQLETSEGGTLYCGDREATPADILNAPPTGWRVYHEGDKDVPKHTTKRNWHESISCALWLYVPLEGMATVYCGDHKAADDEIKPDNEHPIPVYNEGDPYMPHRSEDKPKEREFYPPDTDKGPQLLKADLRIYLMRVFQSIWGT